MVVEFTAFWAALNAIRRNPNGAYPVRRSTDPTTDGDYDGDGKTTAEEAHQAALKPGGAWIAWRLLADWQPRRSPNTKPLRGYPRPASVERERAAAGVSSG